MVWLWIVWGAALVALIVVAVAWRPRTSSTTTGADTAQQAIAAVTDFRCAIAPGVVSTPPQLTVAGPGTLVARWGAATLEQRGVNYTTVLNGPGGPISTVTSGLSTVFSGLAPGSVWSVTVTPGSQCGTGPSSTSGNATVCNGPPANIATLTGQAASGVVGWAAVPGATSYSLTFTQSNGAIVKAVAAVPCVGAICSYPYDTTGTAPLAIEIQGVGPCGFQ